jgi:segregation and condensation protein B
LRAHRRWRAKTWAVLWAGASVDLLIEDLAADLEGRSFEVTKVKGGWILRTRLAYGPSIRAASDVGDQLSDLNEFDVAVLAAVAYPQPITRDGLKDIFGKGISRDLIGRLRARNLIATDPRSPRRGAPYTFVTTEQFLLTFDLESLQDLPDREQREYAGLTEG